MTMRMTLDTETMAQHSDSSQAKAPWRDWAWPACATVLVHGLALATLMLNWAPVKPAPPQLPNSISLTMMSAPVAPLPQPLPIPEPPVEAPPVAEPVIETPPPEPVIDHAAIAREKRAKEQERERERVRERERQQKQQALERQEQIAREQEQEQEQERLRQLQAARAEQARQAAAQRAEAQAQAQAQADQISRYQPLSKTAPDYPRRALDRGIEGDCTVQYDVTPNGKVSKPSIFSCDDPLFERPSLRAAAGFRYAPHQVNGQAVTVPGVRNTFRYRIGSE